ncbi:MAG: glycosyltransferase family 39 protein [Verrucomicrobia bacterium]|nr:glycosyltransferase family 39 protein [Verrucomicrobiota bacterium]
MDPDARLESTLGVNRSAPSRQLSPRTLTPALSHPMGEGEPSDVLQERSPRARGSKREPSLGEVSAPMGEREKTAGTGGLSAEQHWLRLGYVLIGAILLFRLGYIASDTISLSKDEAYQWLWSKHLALSYYSKPPGIALIQFVGTSLWGDTQLGVRFFSPVFAAILSLVLLRFMARNVGARPGFLLLLLMNCTPLMGMGTVLMTVDPPLVLCGTLAMLVGWRAVQPEGTARDWARVGDCFLPCGRRRGFISDGSVLMWPWSSSQSVRCRS